MTRFTVEPNDYNDGFVIVDEDGYERGDSYDEREDADSVCDRLNREES